MELYKEILAHALTYGQIRITRSNKSKDIQQIVEGTCYHALQTIKAIIHDDSLSDRECFTKIEQIICALEEIGSTGGNRHDYG